MCKITKKAVLKSQSPGSKSGVCSSVAHLPAMFKVLGSVPSTRKKLKPQPQKTFDLHSLMLYYSATEKEN